MGEEEILDIDRAELMLAQEEFFYLLYSNIFVYGSIHFSHSLLQPHYSFDIVETLLKTDFT